jgi:hypothetical protein
MSEWEGFPSTKDDKRFPGLWRFGVDFAAASGSFKVIAVRLGDGDIKYGCDWIGPVDISDDGTATKLEQWAERILYLSGGYVHLFPANGDASEELNEQTEEETEEAE